MATAKKDPDPTPECKGWIGRYSFSQFMGNSGISEKRSVRELKRKSCTGCECCGGLKESLIYVLEEGELLFSPALQDKDLCTIEMVNISRDWEGGYIHDFDLEVVKLQEE